jgi:uncharacterized membrane protein
MTYKLTLSSIPVKTLSLIAICLLALDGIYLSIFGNQFTRMIISIQGSPIKLKYISAILCYILLVTGLYYFIILPKRSVLDAFLLGIITYGVYDTTNYATINKWKWNLALLDTIWGGTLFALTTYIVRMIG